MLAARWLLLLAVTGCGARTSLESPRSSEDEEDSDVAACTGWALDGPPFLMPSLAPAETSDIAPSLVSLDDTSLSLLLLRARPPDAPRELVRSRLKPDGAWPPARTDEVIANGFCDARLTDAVDGAFGALVKDPGEGCQLPGGIRWFSPIEATVHPPLPIYDDLASSIIAAAQSPEHGLLVLQVQGSEHILRVVDSSGSVRADHVVPCTWMTRSATWFDGRFYAMGKHDSCVGTGEEGLSVFRLEPSAGTVELAAQWPISGGFLESTAIVRGTDELWYAWRTYGADGLTPPVQLLRANRDGQLSSDPMTLSWTKGGGAFAFATLRDRLVLARYEERNDETTSVVVDWIDREGALLEQVDFPAEPGGTWLDVAVDDHMAIVAWDSYATELSTFRVWLGRASCR